MNKEQSELISVSELRIGLYVELDLGWMSHPFPTGSFRISSTRQIDTIRSLGLAQVRYFPGKSDQAVLPDPWTAAASEAVASAASTDLQDALASKTPLERRSRPRASGPEDERHRLRRCERRFEEAANLYTRALDQVHAQPQVVRNQCDALVNGLCHELLAPGTVSIRLLSTMGAGRSAAHAVNVTVLSLLLGKAMGLPQGELMALGMAAFLHDIGKIMLPERVRTLDDYFSVAEYKLYQDHVLHGVALGRTLGLSSEVLMAMGQHHERVDGGGFPRKDKGEALGRAGRILAVINRYDNLCNPVRLNAAMMPHEAMSHIFAQMKSRFDGAVVGAFIRLMGIYPPGSIVQLTDERYAMVTATGASSALKPRVLIHDPAMPRHENMPLDLEQIPGIAIRRGIKPTSLPLESADYLAPRQRICYFLERTPPQVLAA